MLIQVAATVGQHCITAEDGEALNGTICTALKSGELVEVDFAGATVFATPFFNAMVGTLTRDFAPELLNKLMKVSGLTPDNLELLRRVIKNSREYFSDPRVRQKLDELSAESAADGTGTRHHR